MPHGHKKKAEHGGHGGLSLMSILMNAIADIIAGKQVNKILNKVKGDEKTKQSIKDLDSAYKQLGNNLKSYCEKYPQYCQDILNDPELKRKYIDN